MEVIDPIVFIDNTRFLIALSHTANINSQISIIIDYIHNYYNIISVNEDDIQITDIVNNQYYIERSIANLLLENYNNDNFSINRFNNYVIMTKDLENNDVNELSNIWFNNINNDNLEINNFNNEEVNSNIELISKQYTSNVCTNTRCFLCLQDFSDNSIVNVLPCRHGFCTTSNSCRGIRQWIQTYHNCPACRQIIN